MGSNDLTSNELKKKIINAIENYFIDYKIIIKDDDNIDIKIKKFLLKYKRIIGVVLLIILLIIGYNCNPYHINTNSNSNENSKIIQSGGAGAIAAVARSAAASPAAASAAASAASSIASGTAGNIKAATFKDKAKGVAKSGLKSAGSGLKSAGSGMYDAAGAASRGLIDSADLIFQILFSIAIFVVICIVLVPSLALLIIGIICYVLLKDKIKLLKGL